MIKWSTTWVGHVACTGQNGNTYKIRVEKKNKWKRSFVEQRPDVRIILK
jgi:hypothetical protein